MLSTEIQSYIQYTMHYCFSYNISYNIKTATMSSMPGIVRPEVVFKHFLGPAVVPVQESIDLDRLRIHHAQCSSSNLGNRKPAPQAKILSWIVNSLRDQCHPVENGRFNGVPAKLRAKAGRSPFGRRRRRALATAAATTADGQNPA